MGSDEQVVRSDRGSPSFQLRTNFPIFRVGRIFQGLHVELSQEVFYRLREPFRAALRAAISKLGRHDDACAHVALTNSGYALCDPAFRVLDQVRNDVRVQQIAGQNIFSGAGGRSSISGKASSRGFIVSRSPNRPRLRVGSSTRRSPSRRMIASSPGSSNSTGIRTAWLRSFRNNLTCRVAPMPSSKHMFKAYAFLPTRSMPSPCHRDIASRPDGAGG